MTKHDMARLSQVFPRDTSVNKRYIKPYNKMERGKLAPSFFVPMCPVCRIKATVLTSIPCLVGRFSRHFLLRTAIDTASLRQGLFASRATPSFWKASALWVSDAEGELRARNGYSALREVITVSFSNRRQPTL